MSPKKNRFQKWICIFLGFCFPAVVYSNSDTHTYYYQDRNQVIVVHMNDSSAIVEYSYLDFQNEPYYKTDTLNSCKLGYKGRIFMIKSQNQKYIFKPRNYALTEGYPDSSSFQLFNKGYLRYWEALYKKKLEWQGSYLPYFPGHAYQQKLNLHPAVFHNSVQQTIDSLFRISTSRIISGKFLTVKINNYKWLNRKQVILSDSAAIAALWTFLAKGKPVKRKDMLLLAQYPLTILPLMDMSFDAALLSSAFIYPILIVAEKFAVDRIYAGSTYKICFLPGNKEHTKCKIKIRKSLIIGKNINYQLPFNFNEFLMNYNSMNIGTP